MEYCSAAPPHAGVGIGMERIMTLVLPLGTNRLTTLQHRDLKCLPLKQLSPEQRHLVDECLTPPGDYFTPQDERKLQPLESRVVKYSDSCEPPWGDDWHQVWLDRATRTPICHLSTNEFAILHGDPVCGQSRYITVAAANLKYL